MKGAETPDYTLKPYANDFFSAQIPARFNNRSSQAGTGQPILLQQLFAAAADSNLYADQLALTIGKMPNGGIKELSSVQLRTRSDSYTKIDFSWLGGDDVAFESTNEGYELGVFLAHKDRYVSIVMSGLHDKKSQLTHELQLFVNSIVWK